MLAGAGGNGGGGLAAARHLANHGREVRVVPDHDPEGFEGAAAELATAANDASAPVVFERAGLPYDAPFDGEYLLDLDPMPG